MSDVSRDVFYLKVELTFLFLFFPFYVLLAPGFLLLTSSIHCGNLHRQP